MCKECNTALDPGLRPPGEQSLNPPSLTAIAMLLLALLSACSASAVNRVHHTLQVTLHPEHNRLSVVDKVSLPKGHVGPVRFRLHAGLNAEVESTAELKRRPLATARGSFAHPGQVPVEELLVTLPRGTTEFTLRYRGEIDHPM